MDKLKIIIVGVLLAFGGADQAKSNSDKIYTSFRPEISSKSWLHRIKDDCPGGTSSCGQFCNDIERGRFDCELSRPCYDIKGHCTCVNPDDECD